MIAKNTFATIVLYWTIVTLLELHLASSTVVDWSCDADAIHEIRIKGCAKSPCTIVKGVNLPVEIDFQFKSPKSTSDITINIFIGYWGIPEEGERYNGYGSSLKSGGSCSEFGIKDCPAKSGKKYTLKTNLFVDPKLESAIGDHDKTGNAGTLWTVNFGEQSCTLDVGLNIVER